MLIIAPGQEATQGYLFQFLQDEVFCVSSVESPHQVDSNEYTQYTTFNIKKENHPKLCQICSYGILPRDSRTNSKQPC